MDLDTVVHLGREALVLVLLLGAPAIGAALVVGFVVAVLQAATQVQEQTVAAVPRMIAVYAALLLSGVWIVRQLGAFATQVFQAIGTVGH